MIDTIVYAVGFGVVFGGGACVALIALAWLAVRTLDQVVKAIGVYSVVVEYIWRRKAFQAWLKGGGR